MRSIAANSRIGNRAPFIARATSVEGAEEAGADAVATQDAAADAAVIEGVAYPVHPHQ